MKKENALKTLPKSKVSPGKKSNKKGKKEAKKMDLKK